MSSEQTKKQQEQDEQSQEMNASENTSPNGSNEASVKACDKTCSEALDKLLRVTADFQNYRSRVEKERTHSLQLGQVAVLGKLLSIVDDVDRAIEEAKKQKNADANWLAGFELIAKSLYQLLADHGVSPIEQMKIFDPEMHEALTQVDSPDHESGVIIDVLQKGFMFGTRVLRPAKVTVAK